MIADIKLHGHLNKYWAFLYARHSKICTEQSTTGISITHGIGFLSKFQTIVTSSKPPELTFKCKSDLSAIVPGFFTIAECIIIKQRHKEKRHYHRACTGVSISRDSRGFTEVPAYKIAEQFHH